MLALPANDVRRIAFLSIVDSKTSHTLMTAHPDGADFSFRPEEWWELMTSYWGLPSYWLKNYVGKSINGLASRRVDAYGFELYGGTALPGGAWTTRHDHVKWATVLALEAMGVVVKCEVLDIFKPHVSAEAVNHLSDRRHGQGCVPDIALRSGNSTTLMDVKCVGLVNKWYLDTLSSSVEPQSRYAVRGRAVRVPSEYRSKAHAVDKKYNGTAHDAVGPMEAALNA